MFNKGHRIRLAVSSSNFSRFDVNPNSGELPFNLGKEVVADNTVYFDASHPSAVYLPVVAGPKHIGVAHLFELLGK
ncbi:MAG: CocE/NonD family hydrolase C-terminal non-catalytic domain-containing protein [Phycisphaerae bacterium]